MVKVNETIQSVSSPYLNKIESLNFQCQSGIGKSIFLKY